MPESTIFSEQPRKVFMNKKVRKAVFPAAGLGTRFLPATKSIPKEMLALVDKPIIQYGVEEAIAAGCEDIIIITGRGKGAIEDHFDKSYELEALLESRGKKELLELSRGVSDMVRIITVRQKEALGLGHAVFVARDLIGDEPFAVILPDDVIDAEVPCLKQMIDVFDQVQGSVLATQVSRDQPFLPMEFWIAPRFLLIPASTPLKTWWKNPKFENAPSKQAIHRSLYPYTSNF